MSKKDINKEAEKQGRRNDDALKFIRVIDRILLINNDKRELTEAEKKRGMGDWLETPEGLKKTTAACCCHLCFQMLCLKYFTA